jgi:stage III sporulation protein AD
MEQYFRAVAAVLITVILVLCLRKNQTGIGELLSLLVCGMVIVCAASYIKPVLNFVDTIQHMSMVDSQMLKTLFKVVGVSVTAEITELICSDSGNSALGKTLQFLASAVVICISIPLMESLLELIEGVLSEL